MALARPERAVPRLLTQAAVLPAARESAFRGFMNVPREDFLAPYTRTSKVVEQGWNRLLQLVADNPAQQARLRALMPLWREWEAFVVRCIDLRRSGEEVAARSLEASGFARERMEGLRAGRFRAGRGGPARSARSSSRWRRTSCALRSPRCNSICSASGGWSAIGRVRRWPTSSPPRSARRTASDR